MISLLESEVSGSSAHLELQNRLRIELNDQKDIIGFCILKEKK